MVSGVLPRGQSRNLALAPGSLLLIVLFGLPGVAQTVRPVIAEYEQKARSRFELVNDSLVPVNVVLEARSFDVTEDGLPVFRPLDKSTHLKLSSMSFRIPPQQTYYVFYEASADRYPAWFVIAATFAAAPRQTGLNVQVELPHTVYLLQKEPLAKSDVRVLTAEFIPRTRQVKIELQNTSNRLGRVQEVEVVGGQARAYHPGFPLLPGARRRLQIRWDSPEPPAKFAIRFRKFEIVAKVQGQET